MHVIIATITARPSMGGRYEALLRKVVEQVSRAACLVRFNIHREADRFLLYEIWTSAEAYAELRRAAFFQAYLAARAELVEPELVRSDWTLLHSVGGGRVSKGGMRGYADTRLGQVHYVAAGDGPPLVLLPGAGQSHAIFRNLMRALSDRYRLIAIDTPGSGMSAPLPEGASFALLAQVVTDVMDSLGIAVAHLYGIHTGNKIGAALSAGWPDRAGDLIYCGQSHSIIADQAERNARMRAVTARHFPAADTDPALRPIKAWADAQAQVAQMWWRPDLFAAASAEAARAEAIVAIVDKLQSFESIATLYAANFAYDMQADLERLPHRTLIVEIATPEEDREIGRQGAALLRVIPRSSLVTFEEPGGIGLTLDDRAGELAEVIHMFLRDEQR